MPENDGQDLLVVENLAVFYGSLQVLWGISFKVQSGQIVGMIGANGAGKTTTLNAIIGGLRAKSGSIKLSGEEISGLKAKDRVQRRLALVPEGRQLWPGMTVEDNLKMGAFPPAFRHRVEPNMEGVFGILPRLKERRHQLAGTLSGGEQQMLAIGRGLMAEPKLLMLDEPTLGLAPKLVDEIFRFIEEIVKHGVTILLVGQNVNYTLQVAKYAYVMEVGRIAIEGTGHDLSHNEHVREAYLGGHVA